MKSPLRFFVIPAALCLTQVAAYAINASPHPIAEKQPDGTKITLHIRGDEFFNWQEDSAGYTVLKNASGQYVYAVAGANGELAPGKLLVGSTDPAATGLTKRLLPSEDIRLAKRNKMAKDVAAIPSSNGLAPLGTVKNLVVPIRFSNHLARTLPSQADLDTLFNAVGGHATLAPTGSIRDLYLENSYNQFTLDSTVQNWVNVSNTEQYYANGNSGDSTLNQAFIQALNAIDATLDFNTFDADNDDWIDAIAFVHSGYGAEWGGTDSAGVGVLDRIWSHRSSMFPYWTSAEGVRVGPYHISPSLWSTSGSNIGRIGVIAHETGHFFGLPDLYDSDDSGDGVGSWCMMANSWGFGGSQLYPPHFSSWSKIFLGWTTPTVLNAPGVYNINQWALNNEAYRIDSNFPTDEYLLIENRQPVGIESAIPQGGLVVFHIDDLANWDVEGYPGQAGWPLNGNHYHVAVLQADGDYDLELGNNRGDSADPYRTGGGALIGPNSVPNTQAYLGGNVYATGIELSNISASGASMSFELRLDALALENYAYSLWGEYGSDLTFNTPNPGSAGLGDFTWTFTPAGGGPTTTIPGASDVSHTISGVDFPDAGDYSVHFVDAFRDVTITWTMTVVAQLPALGFTQLFLLIALMVCGAAWAKARQKQQVFNHQKSVDKRI